MHAHRYVTPLLLSLFLCILFPGCGKEPSPDERRADRLLDEGRKAFQERRYRDSRALLTDAHALDLRLGRIPQLADELGMLGHIHARAASFDSAFVLLRAAAGRFRELTDRDAVRLITLQSAALYRQMGDDRRAHTLLTEALRLAHVFKDDEGAVALRRALVPLCRSLEFPEEESAHLTALLDAAGNDAAGQALVYYEMGLSAFARNDDTGAEEQFLRALTLAEQARDTLRTISVMNRLGMVTARSGRVKESFETYTEALRRSDRTAGARALRQEMLIRVGNIYLRSGVPTEASRFYRSALTSAMYSGDRLAEGYLFLLLGHCARAAGVTDDAVKSYQSALDLWIGMSYRRGASFALSCLGQTAEGARTLTGALDHYRIAVRERAMTLSTREPGDLYAECEQVLLGAAGEGADDRLLDLLLSTGRTDDAFWYAGERQAREHATSLALQRLRTGEAGTDSLLDLWQHARSLCIGTERNLEAQLAGGTREQDLLREVQDALGTSSRRLEEAATAVVQARKALEPAVRPAPLSSAEVRKLLPAGTGLLLPVPTARSLYLFLLTPQSMTVEISAVTRQQVESLAREFTSLLTQRAGMEDSGKAVQAATDRRIIELSTTLHRACIRPVERLLQSLSRLLVVSPPALGDLPLHALRRSGAAGSRQYLIEQLAVSYLPSIAALTLDPVPPRGQTVVAGLGHPGQSGADVEYELRDIRAFYRDAKLLFGPDATLERLRQLPADVVHITVEIRSGEYSDGNTVLLLSDGKSAFTTASLPPGVLGSLPGRRAVILSDLGNHRPGKNAGLAGILLTGRTATVILHGQTPLRRSKKYMGELFYTALLAGGTPEAGYREAMTGMIGNSAYAAPHFWAPFFLWGK